MTKMGIFLLHTYRACALKAGKQLFFIVALALWQGGPAFSQIPKPAVPPPAAAEKAAPDQAPAVPQSISVADIAVKAETALSRVRQMENKSRIDDLIETANDDIPVMTRDTSYRTREMRQQLTRNPPLETIRSLEDEWREIELRATSLTRELTRAALQLDRDIGELEAMEATWAATHKAAMEAAAPSEVLDRVQDVSNSIAAAKKQVLADRAKVLALQGKSADIGSRAAQSRQELAEASERAVTRLLYRDNPPLWNTASWQQPVASFAKEVGTNLSVQSAALMDYLNLHRRSVVFHLLFFSGLVTVLFLTRSKINSLSETDESLKRTRKVYDMPIVSAMLIAMLVSTWLYPRPPRALWVIISVLGAAPVLVFARRVIDPGLYSVLYAVVGFYLMDRLRLVFSPLPGVSRLMFLLEALLMMLFVSWTLRRSEPQSHVPQQAQSPAWRIIRFGCWLAFMLITFALAANIAGYVRLADLTAHTVLGSAYTALVLYALTRVGEGLVQGLFHVPPISMLGMVRRHKMLLSRRINRWIKWAAFLFWLSLSLQPPGLLRPVLTFIQSVWQASVRLGSLTMSVGDVVSFFLIIWAAYLLSRFVRFILDEEVYPNLRLDRGLPYAVSTMLHYVLLLSGLVLALGAIGVDMTKFTIVAGAFSVGIGFGLQNIVNNFVSGLIVLFERPIKVGDTIQIGDVVGRVQHIGIRASIMRTTAGAEFIIPNGKLISDNVTNWTLSNQLRQITVPVVTKPDVNVVQLKNILPDIARQNKLVMQTPSPEALFIKRGIDSFEFELRVWTDALDAWLEVKSDLITEINEALRQNEMAAQSPAAAIPGSA